jgi:hypothetical protein
VTQVLCRVDVCHTFAPVPAYLGCYRHCSTHVVIATVYHQQLPVPVPYCYHRRVPVPVPLNIWIQIRRSIVDSEWITYKTRRGKVGRKLWGGGKYGSQYQQYPYQKCGMPIMQAFKSESICINPNFHFPDCWFRVFISLFPIDWWSPMLSQ